MDRVFGKLIELDGTNSKNVTIISLIIIIQLYVGTAYREYSLVPCYYPVLSAASPARNRGSTTRKTALPPYRYMLLLIIFHRRNWRLRFVYAMGTSRGYN